MTVRRSLSFQRLVVQPKTSSSRRVVALDEATIKVLREHRTAQLEERMLAKGDYDGDFIFAGGAGGPLSPDSIGKWFQRIIRDAGLPKIRFHDLRHTWATLALEAGVPAKIVADRLGHSSIRITMDTYTHTTVAQHREAAELGASLITSRPR